MQKFIFLLVILIGFGAAAEELPLQPDQTLKFSVDEVSWLSVDVSPDGQQLVLEALGDLFVMPIGGGEAQPLSQGMAFDSQPAFSPDGKQLAFISDRSGNDELWVMHLGEGTFKQLSKTNSRTEMASPTWSPDGRHIVVSKTQFDLRTYELWAYSLDGGDKGVQITKAKAKTDTPSRDRHNALGAQYDPTGRYLYYARKNGGFSYNVSFPLWQIVRRDLQQGVEDQLTSRVGSSVRPIVSPDGGTIVYATRYEQRTGLRIRDLASGVDEWLAYPVQKDDQESRFTRDLMPGYTFTPDGKQVIVTRDGGLVSIDVATKKIRKIPFTIDFALDVADRLEFPRRIDEGPVTARVLADLQISPKGDEVAFAAFGQIYVHNLAKNETRAVTPAGQVAACPTWSPNGRELAYVLMGPEGGQLVKQRARSGARVKQLTKHPAYYLQPAWHPNDDKIVVLRGSASDQLLREGGFGPVLGSDLVWVDADSGEVSMITPARGLQRPHFGPEADRIYLHANSSPIPGKASPGIVSIRFDGTDRREHLKVEGAGIYSQANDVGAQSMLLSPDGHHALVLQSDQLYVARLLPFMNKQSIKLDSPQHAIFKLTSVGANFFSWNADGTQVYWTVGDLVYRRAIADIEFAPVEKEPTNDSGSNEVSSGQGETTAAVISGTDTKAVEDDFELAEDHKSVERFVVNVSKPRHIPNGTVALVNARIVTMADQGVIEQGVVVVENNRIIAVGPLDEVDTTGLYRIDLAGKTIVPGFIDTHAHYRVSRNIPRLTEWSFLANLAYGVTTGIDVQPTSVDLLVSQDMVDAGLSLGPRAFSTGPGVFNNNDFKSKSHAKAILARYKDHHKVYNLKAYISGSRKQRHWLIQAAKELELMPTTEGALDMKLNLTHAIDGFSGLEHNYPLPHLYDDVVQLTARTKIAYTPTLLVTYGGPWAENNFYTNESPHQNPKLRRFTPYESLASRTLRRQWFHPDEYVTETVAASALRIVREGGQVGVGAHGQLQGLGYHWELWSLASGGASNLEALNFATLMGAQMLGFAQDLGSLEVGKLADLVVLNQNPLDDIRHSADIFRVMKNGELFDSDTLDQVWPEQKVLPTQWWWHTGPK